ncbi:hypothetical protein DL767_003873 [Monosporascus sp. MG133]|nr:hypothetical protein DL767_003873 [Monosporascus sp. MG133]
MKAPSNGWKRMNDESLSTYSLYDLLNNRIPAIRVPQFLSAQEYKAGYFGMVKEANVLQQRFIEEAGVDVVERVRNSIAKAAGIPVRVATEGDRKYFAGLLRVINSPALIHSDYAPYDAPGWKIGQIVSQITWNIFLKQVRGGESVVYNRYWRGKEDDEVFKKTAPSYGYQTLAVENAEFKVIPAVEGDLTFMNSRNFHEVRPLDPPNEEWRYTISSFVGLLPSSAGGPELILWS